MSSKSKYRANKYYLDHPRPVNTNRREQEVKFDDNGRPYTDQTPSEREAKQFLDYQVVNDTYILEGGSSENYSASEDIVQDLVIDQKTLDIINDTLPTPDGGGSFAKIQEFQTILMGSCFHWPTESNGPLKMAIRLQTVMYATL